MRKVLEFIYDKVIYKLYNPKKFNIDELDKSKGKKFGEQIKNSNSFLSIELENQRFSN